MSHLLTLKGNSSILFANFVPPLQLDSNYAYRLALLSFHSYNSIPNIRGSKFYLVEATSKEPFVIDISEGSYEIRDIEAYLKQHLMKGIDFSFQPNNNTLKCEIRSNTHSIDFHPNDSIGDILGFSKQLLKPATLHTSDLPVNIIKVSTNHIDSNITTGAFYNSTPTHLRVCCQR